MWNCGKLFNCRKHEQSCKLSSPQFVDCGEDVKLEIKQETDSKFDDPISVESHVEVESSDSKDTIKLEIKHEIQESEDLQDPLSTEWDLQKCHLLLKLLFKNLKLLIRCFSTSYLIHIFK